MMYSWLASLATLGVVAAKTQTLDWNLSWKHVNPDGLKNRPVVAINDMFPLPVVRVKQGDRLVVNVHNNLTEPARNATVHFHGMFQNGTNHMDGPPMVVQCPQAPETTFTYDFVVDQPGTYWYHAHVDDLYPDGYRQMLIVEDEAPFEYDEEIAFSLNDWYHELYSTIRDRDFMSLYNPSGAEPVPASILLNDSTTLETEIKPNTTYRLRIANTATFAMFHWFIEGQNFTVVEVDGVFTEPYETDILYVGTGQRYSVLFTTGDEPVYRFGQIADKSVFDTLPEDLQLNRTGFLHQKGHGKKLEPLNHKDIFEAVPKTKKSTLKHFTSDDIVKFDDMKLVPLDHMPLLPEPDHDITVKMELTNLLDGVNYAFFNGISYTPPKVPTLYSVLDAPYLSDAENTTIYGEYTNTFVIDHLDVVQLVINNYDAGQHPFHLHGHNFQVLAKGESINGGEDEEDYNPYDPANPPKFAKYPLRRDVVNVNPFSHIVLRWVADNPGVWFFHCHIEWHLTQGLALQFVEAPAQIRQNEKIPRNHLDACAKAGVPTRGNAAGNRDDFFDLHGENRQVAPLPEGFTPKGYAALALSAIVAFTGLWYICWFSVDEDEE